MDPSAWVSAVLLVLAVSASAQNLTVSPAGHRHYGGQQRHHLAFNTLTSRRYMQIHGDLGSAPMMITKLSFRVTAGTSNYTTSRTFDMGLFMGEGNAGSVTNPRLVIASNYLLPPVTVIPRTTFGPTGQAVWPGPNPFVMHLPLLSPFPYSAANPLVWEAAMYGVSGSGMMSDLDADLSSTTGTWHSITGIGCIASTQTLVSMRHYFDIGDVGGTLSIGATPE